MSHDDPKLNHEQLEKLAYRLWEERGRPLWSSDADWFQAERRFRQYTDARAELPLSSLRMGPTEY